MSSSALDDIAAHIGTMAAHGCLLGVGLIPDGHLNRDRVPANHPSPRSRRKPLLQNQFRAGTCIHGEHLSATTQAALLACAYHSMCVNLLRYPA